MGLSAFESEEITKVVNQAILSTKHLLTTNSERIEFNDEFYNFFSIYGGDISPIINDNKDVKDIEDYVLYIDPEDIAMTDEMDDDSLYNSYIKTGTFYIYHNKTPDKKIEMKLKNVKEIFITEEATELMNSNKGVIPFNQMDDDTNLFSIVFMNRELTAPLYSLMSMLDKNSSKDDDEDVKESIETMSQKFLDILVEAGIGANVIAAELIMNRMIRSIAHPFDRPDFTKDEVEPYTIYTVSKALEKNKSITVGLSFQNIKRQILSDDTFTDRNGTSYLDAFYQTNVSTDNYREYAKLIRENTKKKSKH